MHLLCSSCDFHSRGQFDIEVSDKNSESQSGTMRTKRSDSFSFSIQVCQVLHHDFATNEWSVCFQPKPEDNDTYENQLYIGKHKVVL